MMNLLRSGGLGQWIVAAVASLVIVVFVVEFRAARGPANAKLAGDCVVKVPGACVNSKDFYASYGLIVPPGVSSKQVKALKLPEQVLEGLVERELLVAQAQEEGIGIGGDELDGQLMQGRAHVSLPAAVAPTLGAQLGLCIPGGRGYSCAPSSPLIRLMAVRRSADGKFDNKKYEREVRVRTNRGPKQFRELQEHEVIADRMRTLVRSNVRVSREEAFLQFERENSKATVRYVTIDRDWYARYLADLSDKSISTWAESHTGEVDEALKAEKDLYVAGCTLVSEIGMPFEADITDQAKVDLRKKLDEAYARLTKGKLPFEQVARQASQTDSALYGGRIGCLTEKASPAAKELLEAIASLQAGQISPVIETSHGFYVLRVEGKLDAADTESTARLGIARRLASRSLVDDGARKFAQDLVKAVQSGKELSDALAEKLKSVPEAALSDDASKAPKVQLSPSFTQTGTPGPDFSPFSGVGRQVFDLGQPGTVAAEPVATLRGPAVLVLVSKEAAKREDFEKQADELMRDLQESKGQAALQEYVSRLRRKVAAKIEISNEYKNLKVRGSDD